ncbi:MAG: hypothetical protein KGL91_11665 [Xanthomonadaceae bacterium]|nr:hypothetical protein [Xanthomonadaceae bacterium]
MTPEVVSGQGYRLEMAFQPPLLSVRIFGDADSSLPVTREYWLLICQRVRSLGARQLLLLDAKESDVMSPEDLERFFVAIAGQGLEQARIAYVEGRVDQMSRIQEAELMALERGYHVRMFSNESDARLWLRYGTN